MDEDDKKKKSESYVIGQDLSLLSVDELEDMIEILNQEATRLAEAKSAKSQHLSAAEALFKS
ncbi:MAG: DUF1192 domain-containing protein [Pseudomonadota bacterium]